MTDDKGVGEGPLQRAPLRMAAYYYSFSPTGIYEIDRILSAAACAGKAFHNTDCWTEECEPYDGHVGDNPRDWIQNAANDCATVFNAIYGAGRKAERERNWKTVAELCGVNPAERRPCIEKVEEKFWCPVCVCAGKIRGGQDGK